MTEIRRVLVTGSAGFIGFHLSKRLCEDGVSVVGIDNMTPYYDVRLKERRVAVLHPYDTFTFLRVDMADRDGMERLFADYDFDVVVNLAAQAGVRYSLQNPHAYVDSNIVGFVNLLECCRTAASAIWCMHHQVRFTVPIPGCRFPPITTWTTRYPCMLRPKRPTN